MTESKPEESAVQPTITDVAGPDGVGEQRAEESVTLPPILTGSLLSGATSSHPVAGIAMVLRSHLRTDRHQRPYVAMTLRCGDSTVIEARWWQFPHAPDCCPREGNVYCFTGWTETFGGSRQMRVTDAQAVPTGDLSRFAPAVHRPFTELLAEYSERVAELDEELGALVRQILSGETFDRFCSWPAAQYKHGAVRHGLLAHSLRVAALAESLANTYGLSSFPLDRSLIIAASLLHDVGKIQTLPLIAGTALPSVASYLDHVTLGVLMVQSAADCLDVPLAPERLQALLHIILAHHGRSEWGAPIEPKSVEAWLVHLADYAESRLWYFTDDAPHAPPAIVDQP